MIEETKAITDQEPRLGKKRTILLISTLVAYYLISQLFLRQYHFRDDLLYDIWARNLWKEALLFPHHPAFHLLQLSLWKVFGLFIPHLTPYQVAQQLNLLVGTASGLLVFIIVWKANRRFAGAYPAMLLFLFPFTAWFFFMGGEPYTIGVAFSLLGYYYLLEILPWRERFYDYLFLGVVFALMVLLHNFTFPAFVAALIYLVVRIIRKKSRLSHLLLMVGTTGFLLFGSYLLAGSVLGQLSSLSDFWHWLTFYGQMGVWGKPTLLTIPHTLVGLLRALYFGSYVRDFLTYRVFEWYSPIFLAFFVAIGLGTVFLVVLVVRGFLRSRIWREDKPFLLVSALVLFSGLATWWRPIDVDFWVFALAPFTIFVGDMLSTHKRSFGRRLTYGLIAVIFLANFSGEVYPNSRFGRHSPPQKELASALLEIGVRDGDTIFTGAWGADLEVLYLTDLKVNPFSLPMDAMIDFEKSWEENAVYIEQYFRRAWLSGRRVFITEDQITQYNPIIFYPLKYHNIYIEPFLVKYGAYISDTGYTFWFKGRETKIYCLDLEGYFSENVWDDFPIQ